MKRVTRPQSVSSKKCSFQGHFFIFCTILGNKRGQSSFLNVISMTNIKHELNPKWIFCKRFFAKRQDWHNNESVRIPFETKDFASSFFPSVNLKNDNCAIIKQYLQPNFLSQQLLEKTEHRLRKRPTYNPTLILSILHTKLETQSWSCA